MPPPSASASIGAPQDVSGGHSAPKRRKVSHPLVTCDTIEGLIAEFQRLGIPPKHFNVIIVGPGERPFAVGSWEGALLGATVPCAFDIRGRKNTQGHLFPGKETAEYNERNGMVNDWAMNPPWTNRLLKEIPGLVGLLEAIYGEGFHLALDRFNTRSGKPKLNPADAHVDYPRWEKRDGAELMIKTVSTPLGHISVVLLNQAEVHSIAKGGSADGIYFGPKAPGVDSEEYLKATAEAWRKFCDVVTDPKKKGKKVQYWRKAAIAFGPEVPPEVLFALYLAFGMSPLVYPSGKPVVVSPGYSGSYKFYAGEVVPNPELQTFDPAKVYEAIEKKYSPECAEPFKSVLKALPDEQWVCDPTECFTEDFLRRFFFTGAHVPTLRELDQGLKVTMKEMHDVFHWIVELRARIEQCASVADPDGRTVKQKLSCAKAREEGLAARRLALEKEIRSRTASVKKWVAFKQEP